MIAPVDHRIIHQLVPALSGYRTHVSITRLTEKQIAYWTNVINRMPHVEMAKRLRFAAAGDPIFRLDSPLPDRFWKRFKALGGMTPGISKRIGLRRPHCGRNHYPRGGRY